MIVGVIIAIIASAVGLYFFRELFTALYRSPITRRYLMRGLLLFFFVLNSIVLWSPVVRDVSLWQGWYARRIFFTNIDVLVVSVVLTILFAIVALWYSTRHQIEYYFARYIEVNFATMFIVFLYVGALATKYPIAPHFTYALFMSGFVSFFLVALIPTLPVPGEVSLPISEESGVSTIATESDADTKLRIAYEQDVARLHQEFEHELSEFLEKRYGNPDAV